MNLFSGDSVHCLHNLSTAVKLVCWTISWQILLHRGRTVCYLWDEVVSGVLYMRLLLPFPVSLPLPVVRVIVQLRGWACHLPHFHQVGASHVHLRWIWWLSLRLWLRLCQHSGGWDHLRRPQHASDRVACRPSLSFHVQAFQVRRRWSRRRDDAGLAEPPWVLLHHHAMSGHHRRQQSAMLIHFDWHDGVRPRTMSTHNWLQTPGYTWRGQEGDLLMYR